VRKHAYPIRILTILSLIISIGITAFIPHVVFAACSTVLLPKNWVKSIAFLISERKESLKLKLAIINNIRIEVPPKVPYLAGNFTRLWLRLASYGCLSGREEEYE